MRNKILTFTAVFLVWLILTGSLHPVSALVGIAISVLAGLFFSDMLFRDPAPPFPARTYLGRTWWFLTLIPVFLIQAFLAAVHVSRYAYKVRPTFSPGVVRVPTRLSRVTAITILANLITLTPGTLTLDYDPDDGMYTIHWFDVTIEEPEQASRKIIGAFEKRMERIFQ